MKILSLFDGMACGALAMERAGIQIDKYIAYEVDKYSIQTATHNFPFIEERGDVFKADFTEYRGFDYLIGGSPCTYWSIAQTKNRETVASGMGWELFSQYVRALHEAQPKYFLYENNKSMSAAIRASITETFGFEPIFINSALVSAQNRQRLYWCGIRQADGTYKKADIQQPADRGILLKDILETGAQYNAMNKELKSVENKDAGIVGILDMVGIDQIKRVYGTNGKAPTLTTCQGEHREPKVFEKIGNPSPLITTKNGKSFAITASEWKGSSLKHCLEKHVRTQIAEPIKLGEIGKVFQHYEAQPTGKTNNLTTVSKDNLIAEPVKHKTKIDVPIYEVKDGFITVKGKQYPIKLVDGFYIIRKLTVRECMRLQTVPEWYEWPVSKSQAYKMLGNGWTVEVIAHLLQGLK